jgi:hypothetical protein
MDPLKQTVLVFSILIFLLFLTITIIASVQYSKYKIVDGTAICEEFFNRCLLSFNYENTQGQVRTKTSPIAYNEINQSGVFNVKVAFQPPVNNEPPSNFFVIGSPYHVFLGTKSMVVIYTILTFLALLISVSFLPAFSSSSSPKTTSKK